MCGVCGCGGSEARIGSVFGGDRNKRVQRAGTGTTQAWRAIDTRRPAASPAGLDHESTKRASVARLQRGERAIPGKHERIVAA
ncbi:MAG TPA: hydrogenase accessory protein HypB, partial [Thauera sp.]|nr:hydrogenase accessory protein HypB [Thauera sp.]